MIGMQKHWLLSQEMYIITLGIVYFTDRGHICCCHLYICYNGETVMIEIDSYDFCYIG